MLWRREKSLALPGIEPVLVIPAPDEIESDDKEEMTKNNQKMSQEEKEVFFNAAYILKQTYFHSEVP